MNERVPKAKKNLENFRELFMPKNDELSMVLKETDGN